MATSSPRTTRDPCRNLTPTLVESEGRGGPQAQVRSPTTTMRCGFCDKQQAAQQHGRTTGRISQSRCEQQLAADNKVAVGWQCSCCRMAANAAPAGAATAARVDAAAGTATMGIHCFSNTGWRSFGCCFGIGPLAIWLPRGPRCTAPTAPPTPPPQSPSGPPETET
jgi:hypothetical protein